MNQVSMICDWDSIKPLFEELKPKTNEQNKLEEVNADLKSKFKIGDTVKIDGTSYYGVIHGYNESVSGFYPGHQFPLLVKVIDVEYENGLFRDAVGLVFQYGLEQVFQYKREYYKIDAGHRALENGAIAPLSKMFEIASLADQKLMTGNTYGDDYLFVPMNKEKAKAIEDLLTESKLIWEIVDNLPTHASVWLWNA